jgi:hypothetical protein
LLLLLSVHLLLLLLLLVLQHHQRQAPLPLAGKHPWLLPLPLLLPHCHQSHHSLYKHACLQAASSAGRAENMPVREMDQINAKCSDWASTRRCSVTASPPAQQVTAAAAPAESKHLLYCCSACIVLHT